MKAKAVMNWSGGKDSAMALHEILQADEFEVVSLLTTVQEGNGRIIMHDVPEELLEEQAQAIGLPLIKIPVPEQADKESYDALMRRYLAPLLAEGVTHAIFGDIFLEDLKVYREERLAEVGLTAVFPLWLQDTAVLAQKFVDEGFQAITVCVNGKYLSPNHVGQNLDATFFASLPEDVDICGENGEYHSFVYNGPIFQSPVACEVGEIERRMLGKAHEKFRTDYWFAALQPVSKEEVNLST